MPTKRKDGSLCSTITDSRTGKRVYFYGRSQREIKQKILQYQNEKTIGRTFIEVSQAWWLTSVDHLADQSVRTYKQGLNRANEHFGEKPIKSIVPRDITQFLARVAQRGYAQKTLSNQRLVLNLICEYAVVMGDIEYNPCASVKAPRNLAKKTREAASVQDEQIIRSNTDAWLFPFFALMTGMRKGEILALQWKDVDFEQNLIRVSKSVSHNGDRPSIKEPKTAAGIRSVPLLAPLKERLQSVRGRRPNHYIFSDDGKTPLTNRRYITLYSHFQKQTGVSCTAHQLRHSFATIAFEHGIPVKSVQEILGHKQISTTMDIYTDFRKSALDEAANTLNAAFGSSTHRR